MGVALDWLLDINNVNADIDWKPIFCNTCPFGGEPDEPNSTDESEAYFPCSLIGKKVWGENPKCKTDDWRNRAHAELTAARAEIAALKENTESCVAMLELAEKQLLSEPWPEGIDGASEIQAVHRLVVAVISKLKGYGA